MLTAITRPVSPSLGNCELTHLPRANIDVDLAVRQHAAYEQALLALGAQVVTVAAAPDLPDAVFVEDTAVVVAETAVMARPSAASRRTEVAGVAEVLSKYRRLQWIKEPGTLDGGDVLQVGRRVYVGRSSRTNRVGFEQLR